MQEIRNSVNKLVCRIDERRRIVEIRSRDNVTLVQFCDDGTVIVTNAKMSA